MTESSILRGSIRMLLAALLAACGATAAVTAPVAGVEPGDTPLSSCRSVTLHGETPVLFVHGWRGNMGIWNLNKTYSTQTMWNAVDKIPGVKIVDPFDYSKYGRNWITDSHIGPALAQRIDCLSNYSREAGGTGYVIVVAHSMGGLATRYAAASTVNGRLVADRIGQVITIGTPHEGSKYWNVTGGAADKLFPAGEGVKGAAGPLTKDSKEIRSLPPIPVEIPTYSIAGNVQSVKPSKTVRGQAIPESVTDTKGDNVVPVSSATAEHNSLRGGGTYVYRCRQSSAHLGKAPCDHSNLIGTSQVQGRVVDAIKDYLGSRPPILLDDRSLLGAPVPSMCRYPAGQLVNGRLPGTGRGEVALDLRMTRYGSLMNGQRGGAVAAFHCNQGGVSWPDVIVVYDQALRILRSYNTGSAGVDSDRAKLQSLTVRSGVATIHSVAIGQKGDNSLWGTQSATVTLKYSEAKRKILTSSPVYFNERRAFLSLVQAADTRDRRRALKYGTPSTVDTLVRLRADGGRLKAMKCRGVVSDDGLMILDGGTYRRCDVLVRWPGGYESGYEVVMAPANVAWTTYKGVEVKGVAG